MHGLYFFGRVSAGRGAHDAPPDPLIGWGWGGDTAPHPLDACGVLLSRASS